MDILFIHPNAAAEIYQELSKSHSAIETPIWAGLLANHVKLHNFSCQILDCEVEHLDNKSAAETIKYISPRIACFVVYGQQPSASTQNMEGAVSLAQELKLIAPEIKTLFVGGHVAALPEEVLSYKCVDFVCQNEGVYTISNLLKTNLKNNLDKVLGLGWKNGFPVLNPTSPIVPHAKLAEDLPGIAWDLLPHPSKYRTSGWHSWSNNSSKSPFASLYTSLGCPYKCSFCLEENTEITVSNGRNKKIKNINKDDKLLAFDTDKFEVVETNITEIISREVECLFEIELSDGKKIQATGEHPFFAEGNWVEAKDLKVGNKCLAVDKRITEIKNIKTLTGLFKVYNFQCSPYNNFFAENILTHNCMINIINRTDNSAGVASDKSAVFRHWEPEHIIKEFDKLAEMGVKNIKIADELFVLRERHFMEICKLLIERDYGFNIWCYSRIDTCKPEYLDNLKKAGVNFIGLGIESPNQVVRKDVIKGGYKEIKITEIIKIISNAGISVGSNYIFGLPEDSEETMKETLQFAMEQKTENFNGYCVMAYPGSPLYYTAKQNGWTLPDKYSGYSQHSYWTQNLPSKHLSAAEILKFRDEAWLKYFTDESYLSMIEKRFGINAVEDIKSSTKIKLKRRLLGDEI